VVPVARNVAPTPTKLVCPVAVEWSACVLHIACSPAGRASAGRTPATGAGVGGTVPTISANEYHEPFRPPCATTMPFPSSKSEMSSGVAGQPGGRPVAPPSVLPPPSVAVPAVPVVPAVPPVPGEPPTPPDPPAPVTPPAPPFEPAAPEVPPLVVLPPAAALPPSWLPVPPRPPVPDVAPAPEPPVTFPAEPPRLLPAAPPCRSVPSPSSESLHATSGGAASARKASQEYRDFIDMRGPRPRTECGVLLDP